MNIPSIHGKFCDKSRYDGIIDGKWVSLSMETESWTLEIHPL